MKQFVVTAFCGLAAFAAGTALTSCGGGGSSSASKTVAAEGFAPAAITADMVLAPDSTEVRGTMILHADAANTCEFSLPDVDGELARLFIGNYRYTKVAPDIAEVQMDNLRLNPIVSPADMHFTLHGFLKFVDESTVVFSGTETLGGSGVDSKDHGQADVNDPFGFNWFITDADDNEIAAGGSKNFSYTYKVSVMK